MLLDIATILSSFICKISAAVTLFFIPMKSLDSARGIFLKSGTKYSKELRLSVRLCLNLNNRPHIGIKYSKI